MSNAFFLLLQLVYGNTKKVHWDEILCILT